MHKSKITLASWAECVSSLCSLQPWEAERCLVQFEKDGVIQTQEKSQRQHNGLSYSHSWTSQQKVSLTGHSNTLLLIGSDGGSAPDLGSPGGCIIFPF